MTDASIRPPVARADRGVLHICFSESGAASLRHSLRKAGRGEETVIALPDDLTIGPIDPPDPDVRRRWMLVELGLTGWETRRAFFRADIEAFWSKALGFSGRRVVWMTRRCLDEHLGYLEWMRQVTAGDYELVDLTDLPWPSPRARPFAAPPTSLRYLSAEHVDIAALDRFAAPAVHCIASAALWRRLRSENAALRIAADGEVRSAPLTIHDAALLAAVPEDWTAFDRIVGHMIATLPDVGILSRCLVTNRLRALVDAGYLEGGGALVVGAKGRLRRLTNDD